MVSYEFPELPTLNRDNVGARIQNMLEDLSESISLDRFDRNISMRKVGIEKAIFCLGAQDSHLRKSGVNSKMSVWSLI